MFGVSAFGQEIVNFVVVSTPSGGPVDNPRSIYIIDDTIEVEVVYTESLPVNIGSPRLEINLVGGSGLKDAPCALSSRQHVLLCTYTVRENDRGNSISIATNALGSHGNLPDYVADSSGGQNTPIDGIRLTIENGGINVSGVTPAVGFVEEDIIEVTLNFFSTSTGSTLPDPNSPTWQSRRHATLAPRLRRDPASRQCRAGDAVPRGRQQ